MTCPQYLPWIRCSRHSWRNSSPLVIRRSGGLRVNERRRPSRISEVAPILDREIANSADAIGDGRRGQPSLPGSPNWKRSALPGRTTCFPLCPCPASPPWHGAELCRSRGTTYESRAPRLRPRGPGGGTQAFTATTPRPLGAARKLIRKDIIHPAARHRRRSPGRDGVGPLTASRTAAGASRAGSRTLGLRGDPASICSSDG